MAAIVHKLLTLSFLLYTVNCDHTVKSSLVFVIDDTYSMTNVINEVKRSANSIFDTVLNSRASQIENFVLVRFNDPYVGPITVTKNRGAFKQALNNIIVYGGGDCPEKSMTGIEEALKNSLPRSYLYVFTDASANDYFKYEQVKNLAQEKQSQVVFVLTGKCNYLVDTPDYLVYPNLATATSGLVFHLWEQDINQILDYVKETIKGTMTELAKEEFPPGRDNKIPYYADEHTGDVLISVTGVKPKIAVTDPDGFNPNTVNIVDKHEIAVVKVTGGKVGIYTANVGSDSKTTVVVKGRTTIDFQHGFSTNKPTTIKHTATKPQPDIKSYLMINLIIIEGAEVKLTKVKLLDLDGKVLLEQSLDMIDSKERLYVTAPFEAPKQIFRVMVSGHIVSNNAAVTRLGVTPVEPESVRPKIILLDDKIEYVAKVGDRSLRIPCNAKGYPEPTFTWIVNGITIMPGPEYSIVDGDLYIITPNHHDANRYTCIAKNNVGEDTKTFNVIIKVLPKIDKATPSLTVRVNSQPTITCRLLEGNPRPLTKWFYRNKPGDDLQPLQHTGETLHLTKITLKDSGHYTCVAENELGRDQFETHLIVEDPPRIINGETKYTALDGDVVLRIPCNATGYPKPTFTWTVDGSIVVSDSKYNIMEDALLVRTPNQNDTRRYTCTAKNKLGEDSKTFKGIVEDEITAYENVHNIYIIEGTSKNITCHLPHSDSDSLKWFVNEEVMNNTGPYIDLKNASTIMDGNYTCRVSNERGYNMDTYVVDVGNPPKFKVYQYETVIDWTGEEILDCMVDAKPQATAKWFINGNPVIASENVMQMKITGWGQYSCKITNVHGSTQRTFNVSSSACLIHEKEGSNQQSPLLITENRMWPQYATNNNFLLIPHQEKMILSCPSEGVLSNSFKILPGSTEITAICAGQDTFLIDGKIFKYSELQCKHANVPSVNRTGAQCMNKDTEMIQVGYKLKEFVEVYRVCFDIKNKVPLYSQLTNINTNTIHSSLSEWYKFPDFGTRGLNAYTCENLSSSCCIAREQLVSGNVAFGAPQRSTFVEYINTVPSWRSCDGSRKLSWSKIEERVSQQIENDGNVLGVWSGASEYVNTYDRLMPQYLWKVVKFNEVDSLAIIYINDPHPKDNQVLCKNVCGPGEKSWVNDNEDRYTYCCQLSDFLTAFNIPESVFRDV